MNIILVGMNHITAPLEIRERLSIACGEGTFPLSEIMKTGLIKEALYLSTCNRVEVIAGADEDMKATEELKSFVFNHGNLTRDEMSSCLYVYKDRDAVRHLFKVASSLDSLVIGEPQILGQVKEAYRKAVDNKTTGIIMNRILHHAFQVAKRIRTETGIAANAVSVSFAAVELAKKIFSSLKGKTILLIGAGEMSELAARHLIANGVERLLVANRTYERALEMAALFNASPVEFDRIQERLQEADIVISSTGASGCILTETMITAAMKKRRNRLLFLIDIAVPRDIEPSAGSIDNVYLYNIDNLQEIADENLQNRKTEAARAEEIVEEELARHTAWINSLEVVPTIVSLREKMEGIMKKELDKSSSWLRNLSEEDRKNIEILTGSIVNKILHEPMIGLKEESNDRSATPYVAAIRRLFGLDDNH